MKLINLKNISFIRNNESINKQIDIPIHKLIAEWEIINLSSLNFASKPESFKYFYSNVG